MPEAQSLVVFLNPATSRFGPFGVGAGLSAAKDFDVFKIFLKTSSLSMYFSAHNPLVRRITA